MFVLFLLTLGFSALGAQADEQTTSEQADEKTPSGVLVMAHGGDADWNEAVERVVEPLRASYPIEIAFGMAKTSTIRSAVERLEAQGVDQIAVVRMFISGESFLENTEIILGLREAPKEHHQPAKPMNHDQMDSMNTSSGHSMEPPTPIDTDSTFYLTKRCRRRGHHAYRRHPRRTRPIAEHRSIHREHPHPRAWSGR